MLYYCNENQVVIDKNELCMCFQIDNAGHESFSEYLESCMYYNNGSLIPLPEKIDELKRELARMEYTSIRCGFPEEYREEIGMLRGEIKQLSEYMEGE